MKAQIEWDDPEDDPTYDWCGKYQGKWVDLVRRDSENTWSFMFDGERIEEGLETREDARLGLIQYINKKESWPN